MFDWLKRKPSTFEIPPPLDAAKHRPGPGDVVFRLAEWQAAESPAVSPKLMQRLVAVGGWGKKTIAFGMLVELSDGTWKTGKEAFNLDRSGKLISVDKKEWLIPKNEPTGRVVLCSVNDWTASLLNLIETCFGATPSGHPGVKGILAELLILQGRLTPDVAMARCKMFLNEHRNPPRPDSYAEFFVNINQAERLVWLSEKDPSYRAAILAWLKGDAALAESGS
jgi:hypothetical protein